MDITFIEQTGKEAREEKLKWGWQLFGGMYSDEELLRKVDEYVLRACEQED